MTEMPDIIRYRVRALPLALAGGLLGVIVLPIAALGLWRVYDLISEPAAPYFADLVIVLALVICGGLAWIALALAWRRPVGLRLDADGISGFFAPPLLWSDIADVQTASLHRGEGVRVLLTPAAAANRKENATSALARLRARESEVVVNTTYLGAPAVQIAEQMVARQVQGRAKR